MSPTSRTRPLTTRRWKIGAFCLLALCCAFPVMAAEEPNVIPGGAAGAIIAPDANVPQASVTLEARRLPLSQVLVEVKKQTGVDLTSAEGTFAREPKVTMAVSEMPLREWMESLGALYEVAWRSTGPNAFQMRPSGRSQNGIGVRHIGTAYNYWGRPAYDGRRPEYLPARVAPDWKALVDNNLDLEAITTTGVPLAQAPAELQRAVRAAIEQDVAQDLLFNTVLVNTVKGPISIRVARPPGGLEYVFKPGQRNEKRVSTAFPLSADINDVYGQTLGRLDFQPSSRGRELLNDPTLFAPSDPVLAQAAPPAQAVK